MPPLSREYNPGISHRNRFLRPSTAEVIGREPMDYIVLAGGTGSRRSELLQGEGVIPKCGLRCYFTAPTNASCFHWPSSILPSGYVILPTPSIFPSTKWPAYCRPSGQVIAPMPKGRSAFPSTITQSPL